MDRNDQHDQDSLIPDAQYEEEEEETISVVTMHDVLSGRGISIAQHAGNERFRALVNARYDANYCTSYSLCEKRAVAEDIIAHIKSLDPPGRFLKRSNKGSASKNARGLDGPWEELTKEESIKKTTQALRDCNRQDRVGYAAAVTIPEDVQKYAQVKSESGLSPKQLAQLEAIKVKAGRAGGTGSIANMMSTTTEPPSYAMSPPLAAPPQLGKRERDPVDSPNANVAPNLEPSPIGETLSTDLPPIDQAAEWFNNSTTTNEPHKKSKVSIVATPAPNLTPATAASSGIFSDASTTTDSNHHHHHLLPDSASYPSSGSDRHQQEQQQSQFYQLHQFFYGGYDPSPVAVDDESQQNRQQPHQDADADDQPFHNPFEEDTKPAAVDDDDDDDNNDFVDPLTLAAMDGSQNSGGHDHHHSLQDFGPPSPPMGHHDDDPLQDHHHHHDPF